MENIKNKFGGLENIQISLYPIKVQKKQNKNMKNKRNRDTINYARVLKTAECMGVSTVLVRKVINGERNNNKVLGVFMEIQEGENRLLDEVKKLVPFI